MDIKTRIDGLSEAEAKAALLSLLENCTEPLDTDFLDDETIQRERNEDMNYYLDEALKGW